MRVPRFRSASPAPSFVLLAPDEVRVVVYSQKELRAALGQLRRLRRVLRAQQRSPDPAVSPESVAVRLAQVESVLTGLKTRRRGWRKWLP